jgi:hypothetical protein
MLLLSAAGGLGFVERAPIGDSGALVLPLLMGERSGIQLLAMQAPVRQIFVHQKNKSVAVTPLDQMDKLMHDQIFEASDRLFGQFEIEPNAPSVFIARTPLGFHFFDAPGGGAHAHDFLPLRQQRRDLPAQMIPVPALQDPLAIRGAKLGPHGQFDRGTIPQQ